MIFHGFPSQTRVIFPSKHVEPWIVHDLPEGEPREARWCQALQESAGLPPRKWIKAQGPQDLRKSRSQNLKPAQNYPLGCAEKGEHSYGPVSRFPSSIRSLQPLAQLHHHIHQQQQQQQGHQRQNGQQQHQQPENSDRQNKILKLSRSQRLQW